MRKQPNATRFLSVCRDKKGHLMRMHEGHEEKSRRKKCVGLRITMYTPRNKIRSK